MKKQFLFLMLITFFVLGCDDSKDSNKELSNKQEQIMQEANRQVGMPAIVNFQQRKLMKTIIELCDQENLVCYAYLWNEFNGKLVFIGKCIGYGLPYSTQYTNPEKTVEGRTQGEFTTVPQADPNGLFMPQAAEATWIMLIDKNGIPHPVYVEPKIIISPFELDIK